MFNIKFTKELPSVLTEPNHSPVEDAHEVQYVPRMKTLGFCTTGVLLLLMGFCGAWRIRQIPHEPLQRDLLCILLIISLAIAFVPCPYIHELIHAFAYPKRAEKLIILSKGKGLTCYIYCEAEVSRLRLILIYLLPLFLMGLLPFAILMWISPNIPYVISVSLLPSLLYLVFIASIDVSNALMIATRKLPRGAKLFLRGSHLYCRFEQNIKQE
ncbi:MAG: DUF3267 domain-containing protein [Clostridia bacterium]|nr:DUF3267 domain-containing protein [Clostridia bacterium]